MILVLPEPWENLSQSPLVKKILKSNDHSYNKGTEDPLHKES